VPWIAAPPRALSVVPANTGASAMENDAGGGLWFLMTVVGVVILAAAMIYGTMQWQWRRKNRITEQHRDEATRELFREERS
jgi:hypothetical protein